MILILLSVLKLVLWLSLCSSKMNLLDIIVTKAEGKASAYASSCCIQDSIPNNELKVVDKCFGF